MLSQLIINQKEFIQLKDKAKMLISFDREIYNNIFSYEMHNFRFLDFHEFSSLSFGKILKDVSKLFGDEELILITQNPPAENYLQWAKCFGAFHLKKGWIASDYYNLITYEENNETFPSFYFSAISAVLFGDSLNWAFYADRDYGIIVAAERKISSQKVRKDWPCLDEAPWLSKNEAQELIYSNSSQEGIYRSRTNRLLKYYNLL